MQALMTASRAELAWMVDMEGSPEFMAMSRSRASASRTSPMSRRSGRMRSDSLTSRLSVTSPTPSMLGARVCMATQSRLRRASSKTSSQVMIRWPAGMAPHRARSMVVLPDWVAPETRMLSPAWTEASRKAAAAGVSEPMRTRSAVRAAREECLRMLTAQCPEVMGGMTTWSLSPPGSWASTKGLDRSRRRPEARSIRSTRIRRCSSSRIVVVSSGRPERATKTRPGELTQISSMDSSSR